MELPDIPTRGRFQYLVQLPGGWEFIAKEELADRCEDYELLWMGSGAMYFLSSSSPHSLIGSEGLKSIDRVLAYIYHNPDFEVGSDDVLDRLKNLPAHLDWVRPVKLWQQLFPEKSDALVSKEQITFRVTGERSVQDMSHSFTSTDLAKYFGAGVNNTLEWKAKMKEYDVEIVTNLYNTQLWAGIVLRNYSPSINTKTAKQSRRNRTLVGLTSLNPASAFNMVHLAKIHPGSIVIDPMAGMGTIPIEGSLAHPTSFFISGDHHSKAVMGASRNISDHARNNNCVSLLWDVTHLPLRDNSVDAVISDLPFGHRHGTYQSNCKLYPKILSECTRVCITGGTLLFLTLANRIMLRAINQITNLVVVNIHPVFVGGFEANLYHLKKVFHSSGLLLSPGPPASPPLAFSSYQFFFFEI
eukprot:TRINITY_DN9757_c0_g1_i5.p1 TRINITY_DN9757_c0_g1~~TRINITY_DN9757_c0_g1_i5.p1  ORF type:complete len:429 (-),score=73.34 TRINITY_DN9757_c0_g1_i5:586-1824(-)